VTSAITARAIVRSAADAARRNPGTWLGTVIVYAIVVGVVAAVCVTIETAASTGGLVSPASTALVLVVLTTITATLARASLVVHACGGPTTRPPIVARRLLALGMAMGAAYAVSALVTLYAVRSALVGHVEAWIGASVWCAVELVTWLTWRSFLGTATAHVTTGTMSVAGAFRASLADARGRRMIALGSRWPSLVVGVVVAATFQALMAGLDRDLAAPIILAMPFELGVLLAVESALEASWFAALHRPIEAAEVAAVFE
jgi:hypothetical protein